MIQTVLATKKHKKYKMHSGIIFVFLAFFAATSFFSV